MCWAAQVEDGGIVGHIIWVNRAYLPALPTQIPPLNTCHHLSNKMLFGFNKLSFLISIR